MTWSGEWGFYYVINCRSQKIPSYMGYLSAFSQVLYMQDSEVRRGRWYAMATLKYDGPRRSATDLSPKCDGLAKCLNIVTFSKIASLTYKINSLARGQVLSMHVSCYQRQWREKKVTNDGIPEQFWAVQVQFKNIF